MYIELQYKDLSLYIVALYEDDSAGPGSQEYSRIGRSSK